MLGPIQTSFSFPPAHLGGSLRLLSELCRHAPSLDEFATAPFYPGSSQHVLTLNLDGVEWVVVGTEWLLELAQ